MKKIMIWRTLLSGIALGLLLQACGGGGDSGETPPPPPPPQDKFTLGGTISSAAGSSVDGDINDINAPFRPNNTLEDAQPISNPVTLGGYVNKAGQGANGRSYATGDLVDIYKVDLLAGQRISLQIAGDGMANDIDLSLARPDGTLVDASVGQTQLESLIVAAKGSYLVSVVVERGASSYVLTIGQALDTEPAGMRLSDDFVAGEVIAQFKDDPVASTGSNLHALAQSFGLTAGSRGESHERNRRLQRRDIQRLGVGQVMSRREGQRTFPGGFVPADSVLGDKLETLYQVKALKRHPDVRFASPNYLRKPVFTPNDPFYSFQWHYPQMNLPLAWDLTTGTDRIVAVIDTGVLLSHPDLQGQLVTGYDFISDTSNAGDGDGIDPDPNDPGDRSNPDGSSSFHGTHVSGTVAAATNNSIGVAGVAFGAKVMPLRAVGRLGGSLYDIEQAVRYAAGLPNDSGTVPARRADVINLSLGSFTRSDAEQAVYDQVRGVGVVVVAAAGNDARSTLFYPAAYSGVVAVGAVTIQKERASYSNFGSWIDVAAPGGSTATDINGDGKPDGVLSTVATDTGGTLVNDYVIWQGTSMAAPHVSGVVALMKALAPGLGPQKFDELLASGALTNDLGTVGRDGLFGYGLLNAYKAVTAAAALGGQPVNPVPILTVNPSALNFGVALDRQILTVFNGGSGELKVSTPTEDSGGWLQVTPAQVDANGIGRYTVSVQRDGLADGVYSATVTFNANTNKTVPVKIIMQVANNLGAGDAGLQYVLLVNPDTKDTIAEATGVRQLDGRYTYTFSEVPAGQYQIYSGSDTDNDFQICDGGESCGAYLTTDTPVTVEVSQDMSGLDFTSGFTVNLVNSQRAENEGAETNKGIRRNTLRQLGVSR